MHWHYYQDEVLRLFFIGIWREPLNDTTILGITKRTLKINIENHLTYVIILQILSYSSSFIENSS